jgi:tetratricopeptide (TPR) repeat protein
LAVLEAEARLNNRCKLGKVDERARELIETARGVGWQMITLCDSDDRVVLEVTMDGQGRFRFDHRTEHGLRETVVCNGETLRHLYPELGIGTTRSMSRFHRADVTRLLPWLLPTVDDLAVGADLRLIGPRTIAIAPHGVDVKDKEGQPQTHVRLHLEFAADGRLAERRVVEMPSAKTIARVVYSEEGIVRWFDGNNEQRGEFSISVEKADAPDLTPDVEALVVLPMPVRDRDHVYKMAKEAGSDSATSSEKPDALRTIASDEQNRAADPAHWNEEHALRLLAANHLQNAAEMRDVIGRRFFARGDRRIGFYTLLISSGERWDADQRVQLGDGTTTQMDPLSDHPKSTLARYIASQLRRTRFDLGEARSLAKGTQQDFILQLAEYRQLAARWSLPNGPPTDAETRRRELDELFGFLSRCDSPEFAFALLRRLQRRYGDSQPHGRIAEALIELEKHGTISYAVKYELARSLASRGEKDKAQSLFIQLYRETLDEGVLPPIDKTFSAAIQGSDDPFGVDDNGEKSFPGLMRGACTQLIEHKQRPLAIALAWQCRQLGEASLGDILIDQVLTGVPEDEQLGTTLAALEYLVAAGKHDRAEALLKPILSSQLYADSPTLWRLASRVANDSGRLARSVSHLERAMELEYEGLPKSYNVEQVRQRYRQLFASYHELAQIVAESNSDVPLGLVARAVKAADRWRWLDTDVTSACNDAASVLSELGKDDLAWDYLTTPLAMKPNEATAWLNLAETLRNEGNFELADRAYATAFEAEPTNAQILWDHAQLLEQTGRSKEARTFYRRIADNEWQPRFNQIKRRAERIKAPQSK